MVVKHEFPNTNISLICANNSHHHNGSSVNDTMFAPNPHFPMFQGVPGSAGVITTILNKNGTEPIPLDNIPTFQKVWEYFWQPQWVSIYLLFIMYPIISMGDIRVFAKLNAFGKWLYFSYDLRLMYYWWFQLQGLSMSSFWFHWWFIWPSSGEST